MTVPRIHVSRPPQGRTLELEGDDFRYIRNVLRLRTGDLLTVFDGEGTEYESVVKDYAAKRVILEVVSRKNAERPPFSLTLAQSLAKGDKMDFIIQKATELGATRIVPFISTRSVPKLSDEKAGSRTARWRKIAVESSRQCGRAFIPEVTEVKSFEEMLTLAEGVSLPIIFWEEEKETGIGDILRDTRHRAADDIFVVIGPEGGFTAGEVDLAQRHGLIPASLGSTVMRTETAPIAVLSIIQYEKGAFKPSPHTKEAHHVP